MNEPTNSQSIMRIGYAHPSEIANADRPRAMVLYADNQGGLLQPVYASTTEGDLQGLIDVVLRDNFIDKSGTRKGELWRMGWNEAVSHMQNEVRAFIRLSVATYT